MSILWPLGAIASVLYGSLIPFSFDWSLVGLESSGLQFRSTSFEDVLTNILVYIPIGALLVSVRNADRFGAIVRLIGAVFIGGFVSMMAESLQIAIAIRVSSLTDVALNILGTCCGAMIAIASCHRATVRIDSFRRSLTATPSATLAKLLTVGLFVFALVPFDFVLNTSGLHDAFRGARWNLTSLTGWHTGGSYVESLMTQLTTAVWFSIVCYLFAKARLRSTSRPLAVWISSLRHGIFLALLIEVLQLFTRSHNFDLASLLLRSFASGFGAWCAVLVPAELRRPITFGGRRLEIRTPILVGLCAFQVAAMQLSSIDTGLPTASSVNLASVSWIPFEALWHRPMSAATAEILEILVTYGTLAATLGIVLRRADVNRVWIITGLAVAWVALTVETLQFAMTSRTADVTGLLLALLAVVAVAQAFSILRPLRLPQAGSPISSIPHRRSFPFQLESSQALRS